MPVVPTIEVVTPPATMPVSYSDIRDHCRLDDDDERAYVETLIAAATAYAEDATQRSLIKPTLRATASDPATYFDDAVPLPRGPVSSIVSVNGDDSYDDVELRRHGTTYLAKFQSNATGVSGDDVVVTYYAGFGEASTDVPADIRHAIKLHVADLYRRREATSDRPTYAVANGLDAIYSRHRSGGPLS